MQRKFLSNLFLIIAINLLVKPLAIFGIDATVQNRVGSEEYGFYYSLLNFTYLFNILLDFGINNYTTKNVAQYPEIIPKYLGKVMSLRIILFLVYTVVSLGIGYIIGYDSRAFSILGFLIFNQFLITLIAYVRSHFAGMLFFKTDAFISVLDRIFLIVFCGLLLFGPWAVDVFRIEWFVWIQTGCYFLTFVFAFYLLIRQTGKLKMKFHKPFSYSILRQSLPYAVLILLMMIYTRTDSVMLERIHINGKYEAGVYAKGFRLLDASFMFGMIFANLLFPIFSKMIKAKESIDQLLKMSGKLLVWSSIALAIFCFWNSKTILSWIYTADINESNLPFQLLMFTYIGISMTFIYGTLLTAKGNLKQLNILSGIGIALNVALNFFLIPTYGATGAAIATLITQLLVAIAQAFLVYKDFQLSVSGRHLILLVLFSSSVYFGLYLLNGFPYAILLETIWIGGLILFFKVFSVKDIVGLLKQKG